MKVAFSQLLLLLAILSGCQDKSIAEKLLSKCYGKDSCIQQVNKATNFKWEKVYIFSAQASLEAIEKELGISYKQWQDVGDRIIFVDKGKVVYHEEYFPYPEGHSSGTTFFELANATYVGQYATAAFLVKKQENNREWYYVITPIH